MRYHTVIRLKWFLFVVPALLIYLVFFIVPSASSAFYSLTDWDGISYRFVGMENYIKMFQDDKIALAFRNTLFYAVGITILQNVSGLAMALLLDRKGRGVSALRMFYFMPAVFSPLVLGYVWGFMLEPNIGAVNSLLGALHLPSLQLDWLGNPAYGKWMIVLITVWQFLGYTMVIYLAGLQGIPAELYEAGDIDGAGRLSRFRHVTFPLIAPSFTINILLTTIGCLKLFDQIFAMTRGGPGYATQSVATMIYTIGFGPGGKWGYGTAVSIVLFLFILILTVFQVTILRKREVEM